MNKNKQAFTLVEMIVVITILAILGTIAFISLQSYSKSSRDSVRISDLSTMKTSLELFYIDSGKYPNPTESFSVVYSGSIVWNQGTFGQATTNNVDRLDKIPKDPLIEKEYAYSITSTKQEYQLGGIMENSLITFDKLSTQTYAGDIVATAIVTGNYNGQILKTQTGTICEVLSLPTIISGDFEEITDLKEIIENEKLVYNGYNNLPSNYIGSKYKTDEGFSFIPEKLVVYSDEEECLPLYDAEDPSARINLIKNLQIAYSGTIIENEDNIKLLISVNTNDFESLNKMSASVVNNNLGGEIVSSNAKTVNCEDGYHTEDFMNCIDNSEILVITNGTNLNTWNGESWVLSLLTCDTDYYNNGDNTCSPVGNGFFSNSTDITRMECTNNPNTISRNYTYTSDGGGANLCTATYIATCGVDYYESSNGVCSAVGVGKYSPNSNNIRYSCTNKTGGYYTSDGNGSNSCHYRICTTSSVKDYIQCCNCIFQNCFRCDGGKSSVGACVDYRKYKNVTTCTNY
ncbi:MAG: type II secretion system protein [Candidatus Gracilibacteria bacterium]